ncbi:unnamed protein product, partial [Ectocarpus sp. 12 AP-2014]
ISPRKKKIAPVPPSIAETRAGVCAPCCSHHAYSPKYIYPTARNNKTAEKHNSRTHDAQNLIPPPSRKAPPNRSARNQIGSTCACVIHYGFKQLPSTTRQGVPMPLSLVPFPPP